MHLKLGDRVRLKNQQANLGSCILVIINKQVLEIVQTTMELKVVIKVVIKAKITVGIKISI